VRAKSISCRISSSLRNDWMIQWFSRGRKVARR
jgi:hypothetical protein